MKTSEFKIEKSTVECYKIRHESGYWADITIDSAGETGRIQIASDYGDYQRYWGSAGTNFKEFLTGLGIEYAAKKFGADRWFDLDKTITCLKTRIAENIEDKEELKEFENELIELNNSSCLEEFCSIARDCEKLWEFEDGRPDLRYSITPQFKSFWKNVWPIFINQLKTEIDERVGVQAM